MAQNFYTVEETMAILRKTGSQIRNLVGKGRLREFRDGGVCYYKKDEVNELARNRVPQPRDTSIVQPTGREREGSVSLDANDPYPPANNREMLGRWPPKE